MLFAPFSVFNDKPFMSCGFPTYTFDTLIRIENGTHYRHARKPLIAMEGAAKAILLRLNVMD